MTPTDASPHTAPKTSRQPADEPVSPASIRAVMIASFIGTAIEWYDFFLYGTAAAIVFSRLFFPTVDPLVGTLSAFGTFAVGFVARPLGGVVFGHFGDRVGRKAMLIYSLLIMGIATFLIGLLPTFETIGVWAPALLVLLRCLQGIGVGGEWGGAVLMAVEHSPEGRRGLSGAWPQMGVPAGLFLSTVVFGLVNNSSRRRSVSRLGLAAAVSPERSADRRGTVRPAAIAGNAGVRATAGERQARVAAAPRRDSRLSPQPAAGDGHARRRKRPLLHLHRVRPELRTDRARRHPRDDALGGHAGRRDWAWWRFLASAPCRIGSDAGRCISSAPSSRCSTRCRSSGSSTPARNH